MWLDDLRHVKDRRPFEPFEIHFADGREIRIGDLDAVAWQGPDFAPVLHGGHWPPERRCLTVPEVWKGEDRLN